MRFYTIAITNATTGAAVLPASLKGQALTSLLPNGQVNPAALNVELDVPVGPQHLPQGGALVRIWGLGVAAVGNAFNLNGCNITIAAGMSKGLPLANSSQAGLLVKGQILQAYGNWIGVEQSIDLIISPAAGSNAAPVNFVLNWQAGTTLATALTSTLNVGLPTTKQTIQISDRLVLNHTETGYYASLGQLARAVMPLSRSIITDAGYPGVSFNWIGQTILVTDQTGPAKPVKTVAPQDLLGQPTWIAPQTIQVKLVMRGDISLQDVIYLPPTVVANTAAAMTSLTKQSDLNKLTFSGNFIIQKIHHFGNFRQPDAASWNTTLEMVQQPKSAA